MTPTNLKNYNVLVRIPATGGMGADIKWALKHKSCSVTGAADSNLNGVWHGVLSLSGFRQSLGSFAEGNTVFPAVFMRAARGDEDVVSDDLVEEIRSCDYLVGAQVQFYLTGADRPEPSTDNLFHVGIIERGDLCIDVESVQITCRDRLERDDRRIPATQYADQDPIDEAARGRFVPILFGDWGAESSDYWIPAACVDTDNSGDSNLVVQICRPGENGIDQFGFKARWQDSAGKYKRDETGYRELSLTTSGEAEGRAELIGSCFVDMERVWEDGDQIWIKSPRGERSESQSLITNPVDVIRHFLIDARIGLGLGEADLDSESFDLVRQDLNEYQYRCRGYIDEETTVLTVISQICCEFGLKLIIRAGRYALIRLGLIRNLDNPALTLAPENILSWKEWNDRNRVGFDGLDIRYRLRPGDDILTRRCHYDSDPSAKSQAHVMEAKWIYDEQTAIVRTSNWALMFGGVVKTLQLEMDFLALGIKLGQFVRIEWSGMKDIFQVTQIDYDFDLPIRLTMELMTLNRPKQTGVWSADVGEAVPDEFGGGLMPATWDQADESQRIGLSFWADDSGENSDESNSKVWG